MLLFLFLLLLLSSLSLNMLLRTTTFDTTIDDPRDFILPSFNVAFYNLFNSQKIPHIIYRLDKSYSCVTRVLTDRYTLDIYNM